MTANRGTVVERSGWRRCTLIDDLVLVAAAVRRRQSREAASLCRRGHMPWPGSAGGDNPIGSSRAGGMSTADRRNHAIRPTDGHEVDRSAPPAEPSPCSRQPACRCSALAVLSVRGTRFTWSTPSAAPGEPACPGIARRPGSPAGRAREPPRSLVPVDQPETAQVDPDAGFQQVFRRKGRLGPGRAARKELDDAMAQRPDMCREHLWRRALVGRDVL